MRHVFITGAAGFIGGYAVKEFVAQGSHVLALIHRRRSAELQALAERGAVTIVQGDVTRPADLRTVLRRELGRRNAGLDAIVHCAGRATDVGWRRSFRRTNFEAVRHMACLAKEFDACRFVFISTTDVYGLRDFNGEREEQLSLRANVRNPYPEFKIAAENWIREHLAPAQFAILRPATVWGVGDPTFAPRILAFLRWSPWIVHFGKWRGRNRWPLAHVRNVAAGIYLAATLPEAAGQAINVLDNEVTTADEFYRALAGIFMDGRRFRSITVPFALGQVLARSVSLLSNLLNLNRPFLDPSFYALHFASRNLDFSNERFQRLLAQGCRTVFTREQGIAELQAAH